MRISNDPSLKMDQTFFVWGLKKQENLNTKDI